MAIMFFLPSMMYSETPKADMILMPHIQPKALTVVDQKPTHQPTIVHYQTTNQATIAKLPFKLLQLIQIPPFNPL